MIIILLFHILPGGSIDIFDINTDINGKSLQYFLKLYDRPQIFPQQSKSEIHSSLKFLHTFEYSVLVTPKKEA